MTVISVMGTVNRRSHATNRADKPNVTHFGSPASDATHDITHVQGVGGSCCVPLQQRFSIAALRRENPHDRKKSRGRQITYWPDCLTFPRPSLRNKLCPADPLLDSVDRGLLKGRNKRWRTQPRLRARIANRNERSLLRTKGSTDA